MITIVNGKGEVTIMEKLDLGASFEKFKHAEVNTLLALIDQDEENQDDEEK